MEADWYVDPLGRFHGRFFDGESWTDRVSDDGVLVVDPDWPPASLGDNERVGDLLSAERESFEPVGTPAVVSLARSGPRKASMLVESPVRVVAVLEDRNVAMREDRTPSTSPVTPDRTHRPAPFVSLAVVALAALALVLWLVLRDEGQGRAEAFDPSDRLEVGSSSLLNGVSTLDELARWHVDFARERGATIDDNASCWFAELAGTMVTAVHCGPVGLSGDGADFRFDSIPLRVEDTAAGQIVEPLLGDVLTDEVLAHGLELIGSPDQPAPPDRSKSRGDRATGD